MNESSLAVSVVPDVLVLLGITAVLGIVVLVCISFLSNGERKPRGRNFSEAFDELLRKYDLVDAADLKKEFNVNDRYRFTLLRKITHEAERFIPLPEKFIEETRSLVYECFGDLAQCGTRKEFVFRVKEEGMTLEEIHRDQEEWEYRCKVFWASYG
ncbi:MAG: hypothetical protein WBC29_00330 [Candidatus Moraniibacteriota bacterium]